MQIEALFEQASHILSYISLDFKRYLFHQIHWKARLIGIKGARGTGKTTLLLQWLKSLDLPINTATYFSLDDLYFTKYTLKETAVNFYKGGGKILVLDEVHKYPNWSVELKNLYDFYPDLQIVFTSSSIIELSKQEGDLSRRALIYELQGLSYREFLNLKYNYNLPSIELDSIIKNPSAYQKGIPKSFRPLQHFSEYLDTGYYPFTITEPETAHQRINQMIRTIVEYDMAELPEFDIRNAKKMLQLAFIIAQQVPFKPNISELAIKTGIHRNTLNNYLQFLERAALIHLLQPAGISTATLQKPEKIYLNNSNLMAALALENNNIGTQRETFLLSMLKPFHKVSMTKIGDFLINYTLTFEVGGRNKTQHQIKDLQNAFVLNDQLEWTVGNHLPLWLFGMTY